MKARPILMHGRSIQNLLAGRKTQTRRIVKPQPAWPGGGEPVSIGRICGGFVDGTGRDFPCRYGESSDLLYVRETHYVWSAGYVDGTGKRIDYRATEPDAPCTWTPSIHMPRWASRITLQLTDVRVERVQEIDPIDCWREGIRIDDGNGKAEPPQIVEVPYLREFQQLWDETNGPGAWDRNDWCWCLGFRVIEANVDDVLTDPARFGIGEAA